MVSEMTSLLRLSRSEYDFVDQSEVVRMLELNAAAAIVFSALMLMNLIGLARSGALGSDRVSADLKSLVFYLLNNKHATLMYLRRQLVLLGGATLLIEAGNWLGEVIRPAGLGYRPEDIRATTRQTLAVFAYCCGFVLVWNASLHLLARLAVKTGLSPVPASEKAKADAI